MTDRYSFKDAAAVFGIPESRLRYWAQTGFINPSIRVGGRRYYTFRDLIQVRAAKELLDAGASLQKVRKNLESLRALLPEIDYPASAMRISSDGETVIARAPDDVLFEPRTGQLVMDFSVSALSDQVADILALPTSLRSAEIACLAPVEPAGKPGDEQTHERADERLFGRYSRGLDADVDEQVDRCLREHLDGQMPERPTVPAIADMLLFEPIIEVFANPDGHAPDRDRAGEERAQAAWPTSDRVVGDRAVHAYPLAREVANDQIAPFVPPARAEQEPTSDPPSIIDKLAVSIADSLARPSAPTHKPARESPYETFIRGCDAEEKDDLDTATTCYERALQLQPTLSAAHTNLGHVRYRLGDKRGARRAFERALELEPAQPEARFNLASLLEDSGDIERAIDHLRRVLWTHPRFADGHYNLARLLARQGRVERAREHLTRYLRLDDSGDWSDRAQRLLAALR